MPPPNASCLIVSVNSPEVLALIEIDINVDSFGISFDCQKPVEGFKVVVAEYVQGNAREP